MKINQTGMSGINPYQKQLNAKAAGVKKSLGQQPDKLEISSAAKEMQEATKLVAERQDQVAKLKQQVAKGEYVPNPEQIAKGLINFFKKS